MPSEIVKEAAVNQDISGEEHLRRDRCPYLGELHDAAAGLLHFVKSVVVLIPKMPQRIALEHRCNGLWLYRLAGTLERFDSADRKTELKSDPGSLNQIAGEK